MTFETKSLLERLTERLEDLHSRGYTWKAISQLPDFYGIPRGTLERISKGREPKDPSVRKQLGLPNLSPTCGQCWRLTAQSIERVKRSKPKRIQDYPITMLRAALEMREEV
jgi:hypothetical protein